MIRVSIVDDNKSIAENLAEKIKLFDEFGICFVAKNGKEACQLMDQSSMEELPQVILMDIEMPVMDGIETTAWIKARFPDIKILMLSAFDNDDKIFEAIRAGASGYFLKEEKISVLIAGIDEVLNGGAPMSRLVASKTLKLLKETGKNSGVDATLKASDFNLTAREIEVLEYLSKGKQNKEIADACFISSSTVKKHIEHIYFKLHVSSRVDAIRIALKNNWV